MKVKNQVKQLKDDNWDEWDTTHGKENGQGISSLLILRSKTENSIHLIQLMEKGIWQSLVGLVGLVSVSKGVKKSDVSLEPPLDLSLGP